tara:strand:+ start:1533 stop:1811 length:279 start_codon:yes stop_codon:yes gene_type:complete
MGKKKDYDMVEVLWIDAEEHGEIGWNVLKEQLAYAKKPCPIMKTVGFEVYRDNDHISLLSTIGDKECSTVEKIPISFIKSIRKLVQQQQEKK